MLAASHLSFTRGLMTAEDVSRLATLLREMGPLPAVTDLRASDALDVISRDKKVVAGRLHFVLARGIGATEIVADVQTRELTAAMKHIGMK
jgi:3-dehydroquinate synthase